jgi:hypothetical protein
MANTAWFTPSSGPLGQKPLGSDFNAGTTTRPLTLISEDGTRIYYLWVATATGSLRIASAVPTSDTSGVSVGNQTT